MASLGLAAFLSLFVGLIVGFIGGFWYKTRRINQRQKYIQYRESLRQTKEPNPSSPILRGKPQDGTPQSKSPAGYGYSPNPASTRQLAIAEEGRAVSEACTPVQHRQQQQQQPGSGSPGHRKQLSSVVDDEYEMEDLDEEWRSILADLDALLRKQHRPPMGAKERSLAIKSLLTQSGAEQAEAYQVTVQDILTHRQMVAQSQMR